MNLVDVAVIGGGPAGATCAAKLAELGLEVTLLEKGERERQHRGESLPSSVRVLFESLSLTLPREALVERPPRHLVYWGGARGEQPINQEQSFLVWRGPFDESLRRHARDRGATVVDATVTGVELGDDRSRVHFDGSTLTCRFIVDASGRAGVLAKEYRERESGFRTLALTAHFRTEESDPPTLVESFASGWAWSAPLGAGLRDVTLMLDSKADFEETLPLAEHVYRLVEATPRVGDVRGIDATPYRAKSFCGPRFILVGDAASFLDPLAAHGVHKAMDGGLVAAIVARTMVEHPEREHDAAEFYHRRESEIYRVTYERLRGLYAQETRYQEHPFWKKRSLTSAAPPSPPPSALGAREPLTPEMKLSLAPDVEIVDAPVVEHDLIERLPVLRSPRHERPVRYYARVCLPDLVRELADAATVGEAVQKAPIPADEAVRAIEWLYRSGYLVE